MINLTLNFPKTLISIMYSVLIAVSLSGCELEDATDGSSEGGVSLRGVDIYCLVTDAVGCSSGNDGETLRVGVVDDCDTFSSSSEVFAVASGAIDCDAFGCEMNVPIEASDFSPSSISAGTYDLYAYIDEDGDSEPDTLTEPIGCYQDITIDGTTTEVTINDWE